MSLDFTDIFCGAGGSSTGLVEAGLELKLAANHSKIAIESHQANHPNAEHLCKDINNYDMRRLPHTRILWASPICQESSPAGGRRRTRGQTSLLEEHGSVDPSLWERTRATAYDVIRATEIHNYDAVVCEDVLEFATDWPLFDWWRKAFTTVLNYTSQVICVSSAHVGDQNNLRAPQWRDRFYIVFLRKGIRQPDLKPRPLAWCMECDEDVYAEQAWRNNRRIGKYRAQYDYRCPNSACRHAIVEPYVRPASAAIDWTDLGPRIGDRPRTAAKPEGLAPSTIKRIRAGLAAYPADPTMITVAHAGHDGRAFPTDGAPLPARTGKIGEGLLVPCGGQRNTTATPTNEPMRTRMANPKNFEALVTYPQAATEPYIVELRNHGGHHPADDAPLATIAAGGNHHGLVTPPNGTGPLPDGHALVIPYRNSRTRTTAEPLHTLSTVDSAALLSTAHDVADCRFRMLQPREQLNAQRFPHDYIVLGTKGEQTLQAGNAVSCNVARWIGEKVAAALS